MKALICDMCGGAAPLPERYPDRDLKQQPAGWLTVQVWAGENASLRQEGEFCSVPCAAAFVASVPGNMETLA